MFFCGHQFGLLAGKESVFWHRFITLLCSFGLLLSSSVNAEDQHTNKAESKASTSFFDRFLTSDTQTDQNESERIQLSVIDSYIELHSGPGRGYPIINTIEQGDQVNVYKRRGNWYLVSDRRLREGWVPQEKLARTIASTGLPAALPEVHHGDYLAQKFNIGFALGQQDDDETASVLLGYRLFSFLSVEAEIGQVFADDVEGYSYGGSLLLEPIKSLAFTPFISHGYGKQKFQQKETLNVGRNNDFDSDYRFTGAGINYYIGLNFVVRGEYRKVHISGDNGSTSNSAWRIGFSSFF